MPTYTYFCGGCNKKFELFSYIKDYIEKPKCINCKSVNTQRLYCEDALTQSSSVKKSDSELKTIGDLAKRNSERMSDDEKAYLYKKHNAYKDNFEEKTLPSGMSRIKKSPKIKWPGGKQKTRRKLNDK